MLPSDRGGRYAGPEHIEPRRSQTLLRYLIIFCKIYSAAEGIDTEFITVLCKYEHGEVEKVVGWSGMDVSEQNSWMSDPPKNSNPDALGERTGSVSPEVLEELGGPSVFPPKS